MTIIGDPLASRESTSVATVRPLPTALDAYLPSRKVLLRCVARDTRRGNSMYDGTPNIPARKSRQSVPSRVPQAPHSPPDIEEDDRYYLPTQMPRSARRYVNTEGHEVIEQGGRRLVIHRQPPAKRRHWLLFVGVGMMATLVLFVAGNWASN